MMIEIEIQSLDQIDAALAAGADTLLLDNLSSRNRFGRRSAALPARAKIEVSGGRDVGTGCPSWQATGADYVSNRRRLHAFGPCRRT